MLTAAAPAGTSQREDAKRRAEQRRETPQRGGAEAQGRRGSAFPGTELPLPTVGEVQDEGPPSTAPGPPTERPAGGGARGKPRRTRRARRGRLRLLASPPEVYKRIVTVMQLRPAISHDRQQN